MLDQPQTQPTASPRQAAVLLLATLLVIMAGIRHTLPTELPPNSLFSIEQAMRHVERIAHAPHPIGSANNARVRDYLIDQIKQLGYQAQIQADTVINPHKKLAGKVQNILVRVPGKQPGKALLIAAHYDSVPTGPGAADDGASVAAMLEVLRIIRNQPRLNNDVILLFTDGEEAGLLGAQAFVSHPVWLNAIGLALNFEYRGNGGSFMMFETSAGNARLIAGLAQAVPFVSANSLMYEVYQRLPNDTDFSVFKQAGMPGMNFAAIEGLSYYHTQLDRPENLDRRTLQQEGELMLGLISYFGNRPWAELAGEDRIYFDMPGFGLIHYGEIWVMPLTFAAALLSGILSAVSLRKKHARAGRILFAAVMLIVAAFVLAGLSQLMYAVIGLLHPEYDAFVFGDTYNSYWYLSAFVMISIGLFQVFQNYLNRWCRWNELLLGAMFCWLFVLMLISNSVPGASFLLFWPLAAMLVAAFPVLLGKTGGIGAEWLIFLGSVPGLLLFSPLIKDLFIALSLHKLAVVVFLLIWLSGLLGSLLQIIDYRKALSPLMLISGIGCLLMGSATAGFNDQHPRPNSLVYAALDEKAFWLSLDKKLDSWTSVFLSNAQSKQKVAELLGGRFPAVWQASAPVLDLPSVEIETLHDTRASSSRSLILRITPPLNTAKLQITAENSAVLYSKVEGVEYSSSPQTEWHLESVGMPDNFAIELGLLPYQPLRLKIITAFYGLPALARSRPPSMISKPVPFSDSILTVKYYNY